MQKVTTDSTPEMIWSSEEKVFFPTYDYFNESSAPEYNKIHSIEDLIEARSFAARNNLNMLVYLCDEINNPFEANANDNYVSEQDSARERWSMFHNEYK